MPEKDYPIDVLVEEIDHTLSLREDADSDQIEIYEALLEQASVSLKNPPPTDNAEVARIAAATLTKLRSSAARAGRQHITIDDCDRVIEQIIEERAASMRGKFENLPDDLDPTGHGSFDDPMEVADTVLGRDDAAWIRSKEVRA